MLKDIVYDGDCYEEKISDWLDIAAYWFEEKDAASAESYVNKIMHVIHHSKNPEHIIRYRMAYAKVQDSNRDFINAAQGYYNACNMEGIDAETVEQVLDASLTCTILAPSGPRKARLLAILYNEERLKSNQFFPLLSKMFIGEVIRREHVEDFKGKLEDF